MSNGACGAAVGSCSSHRSGSRLRLAARARASGSRSASGRARARATGRPRRRRRSGAPRIASVSISGSGSAIFSTASRARSSAEFARRSACGDPVEHLAQPVGALDLLGLDRGEALGALGALLGLGGALLDLVEPLRPPARARRPSRRWFSASALLGLGQLARQRPPPRSRCLRSSSSARSSSASSASRFGSWRSTSTRWRSSAACRRRFGGLAKALLGLGAGLLDPLLGLGLHPLDLERAALGVGLCLARASAAALGLRESGKRLALGRLADRAIARGRRLGSSASARGGSGGSGGLGRRRLGRRASGGGCLGSRGLGEPPASALGLAAGHSGVAERAGGPGSRRRLPRLAAATAGIASVGRSGACGGSAARVAAQRSGAAGWAGAGCGGGRLGRSGLCGGGLRGHGGGRRARLPRPASRQPAPFACLRPRLRAGGAACLAAFCSSRCRRRSAIALAPAACCAFAFSAVRSARLLVALATSRRPGRLLGRRRCGRLRGRWRGGGAGRGA